MRIDVLPPMHLWCGDVKLERQNPDARAWIIYMDGEEFARVERRNEVPVVLGLLEGQARERRLLARMRELLWL